MQILGIAPGAAGVFVESPLPSGVTLPSGVVPVWTSSDPVNAPVTSSLPDGSGCTVTVPATATVPSFVLTVSATLPDGTTPSANATVPINFPEVTGFAITQTS